jgi:hypothetical protein
MLGMGDHEFREVNYRSKEGYPFFIAERGICRRLKDPKYVEKRIDAFFSGPLRKYRKIYNRRAVFSTSLGQLMTRPCRDSQSLMASM